MTDRIPASQIPEAPKTTGPGAWLRGLLPRFDRLLSLDHSAARKASEEYDEAYHDAVHALKDLRHFAAIIAPTWTAAASQIPEAPTICGVMHSTSDYEWPCSLPPGHEGFHRFTRPASPAETTPFEELVDALMTASEQVGHEWPVSSKALNERDAARQSLMDAYKKLERDKERLDALESHRATLDYDGACTLPWSVFYEQADGEFRDMMGEGNAIREAIDAALRRIANGETGE